MLHAEKRLACIAALCTLKQSARGGENIMRCCFDSERPSRLRDRFPQDLSFGSSAVTTSWLFQPVDCFLVKPEIDYREIDLYIDRGREARIQNRTIISCNISHGMQTCIVPTISFLFLVLPCLYKKKPSAFGHDNASVDCGLKFQRKVHFLRIKKVYLTYYYYVSGSYLDGHGAGWALSSLKPF